MSLRTCVSPQGKFIVGEHTPGFTVKNFRTEESESTIGRLADGTPVNSNINFPETDITVPQADTVYEIANPLPFRGTTYINSRWADKNARHPENIHLPKKPSFSFTRTIEKWLKKKGLSQENQKDLLDFLPPPLLSALADSSDDPEELVRIAEKTCTFVFDQENKRPTGLVFKTDSSGIPVPDIKNHALFDTVANNIHLPDDYKAAMVLTPGIQGTSPITGDWKKKDEKGKKPKSHVFEYLRQNSYIPWGHFAANTADDTVRYRVKDLVFDDIKGMRRLFYQRIYTSVAVQLGIELPASREKLSRDQLEEIRKKSLEKIRDSEKLKFNGSLWGWNFGFGFAHCGYRLHASHQQIHQQYAMIPEMVSNTGQGSMPSFACGDMVAEFIEAYRQIWGKNFFETYMSAIRSNERVDRDPKKSSRLVVFEDDNIMVFVPKAQTSQWELQLMPLKPCGNILEADEGMRCSLDRGILTALKILEAMGAEMITSIEYSKRFDSKDSDQRVVYAFLPKIPFSPGAFSEAQLRWINGHYPEDFALACRSRLKAFE